MWSFPAVIVLLTVVIIGIHDVKGSVSRGKVESNNGNCVGEDGNEHAVGESWFGEVCRKHTCSKIDDEYYEVVVSCGARRLRPGCHLEQRPGEYPDCCPIEVCNKRRMMVKNKRNAEMERSAYFLP